MMIIDTLTKRRNAIAVQILELQQSIVHIDATIKLFKADSNNKPEPVKRPRSEGLPRKIFDMLRTADKPLTTRQIADMINVDAKRVGITLNTQQKKGLVNGKREGVYAYWTIKHLP